MTRRLVECVPNFSEGRRPEIIDAIAAAIAAAPGVFILDRHVDASHNRSVLTLVGEPEAARDAAFRGIEKAAELIDIAQHRGVHPRIGACDVVPFVPLGGTTMKDCVALAETLGALVGEKLGIPVYLYEEAARRPERKLLANVRKGEFEALREEIGARPERDPDYGPPRVHPSAGAVAIGARNFLVAFNVNIASDDLAVAKAIAAKVREAGGGFEAVRALGLKLDSGQVQVSMNLVDYRRTGLLDVFRRVRDLAREHGAEVRDSEVIGLVPEAAVLAAARDALRTVRFDRQQVIEERLRDVIAGPIDLHAFLDDVASTDPAPGGGSAGAIAGALAAAAAEKVANLTRAKDELQDRRAELDALARELRAARWDLLRLAERDATAYEGLLAALRLPKDAPEDAARRAAAVEPAALEACRAPLAIAEAALRVVRAARTAGLRGTKYAIADAQAAAAMARGALESAHAMFRVNLPGLKDTATAAELLARFHAVRRDAEDAAKELDQAFEKHLAPKKG